ncbi:hypothetical protein BN1708_003247 [Verticillium longisporum]|uniref:Uncharacterized protein n=1 Tax=Verticillium longisporum TaxID=100787 RepID=A0A0G4LDI6_VERLO|nr:hypothetical protein BN1708_003247 [Verticillium longisporum]
MPTSQRLDLQATISPPTAESSRKSFSKTPPLTLQAIALHPMKAAVLYRQLTFAYVRRIHAGRHRHDNHIPNPPAPRQTWGRDFHPGYTLPDDGVSHTRQKEGQEEEREEPLLMGFISARYPFQT